MPRLFWGDMDNQAFLFEKKKKKKKKKKKSTLFPGSIKYGIS